MVTFLLTGTAYSVSTTGPHTISSARVTPSPTPTPTPSLTPSPTPPPSSSGSSAGAPLSFATPTPTSTPLVAGASTARPSAFGLKEGDTISAVNSSDPDVYIVNDWGFKRLFLNPVIFGFYGHLGGFSKVKGINPTTRDAFLTSGLFRNCETNDPKVYAVDVSGEDTGSLHWVNMTGAQAVAEDSSFFQKVFCINSREFSWYPKSSTAYTSLLQVPVYIRAVSY